MSNAIGQRYAKALFGLAKETDQVGAVEKSLGDLSEALTNSEELSAFFNSPLFQRDEQVSAVAEIAKKAGLDGLVANTVGLMAKKRRLAEVPAMIEAFQTLAANDRGEVSAEVVSAAPLDAAQEKQLAAVLKKQAGKDVKLTTRVDEGLLGGLVVKMGSIMIDGSLKGKLSKLHNAMKEVG